MGAVALLQRLGLRPRPETVDPEIALIIQELDEELAREHGLLADGLNYASRDIGDLLRGFAQRCQKIALVGSYRRGKPEPGDIDVLYIPKSHFQVIEFLEQATDDEKKIVHNEPRWTCPINGRQVDFIESSTAAWGMDMVQFTGSREFNERVLRHARRRGFSIENARPVTRKNDGYGSITAPAFNGWSEEKILTHLGLEEFLSPHKREVSVGAAHGGGAHGP